MKASGPQAPRGVQVPPALLWGLVVAALAGALATAYLLGRLGAGSPPPFAAPASAGPDATASTSAAPGLPAPAGPVADTLATPESVSPGVGSFGPAGAPSASLPAPVSAPPVTDEERRQVQRYFADVDALLQGHSFSGDPQALAQKLLQQATSGDTSGLDALFAAQEAAARALRGLEVPPPCQEHHGRTLALAEKTLDLGRKVQAGLAGGDTGPLPQLAPLGREAEEDARALQALDRRLRQAYGVPIPP